MLGDVLLGGTNGVLPGSGASLQLLKWTQNGAGGTNTLGNGVANIVFTPTIGLLDIEQVGLHLVLTNAANPITTSVVMRLRWSPDNVTFGLEVVEEAGALVGAAPTASRRFDCNIKEWGPLAPSTADGRSIWIHRPPDAHFMQVGIYSTGAPTAGDTVVLNVERQRGSALQGGGA